MGVPRHTHTREDEVYYVLSGELQIIVGDEVFILREGDSLVAPRSIPHQLGNSGDKRESLSPHVLAIRARGFPQGGSNSCTGQCEGAD
jgi:quercetin dioxygenase-like cupin family protein